jgi:nucleotide-binding universal stress UspA family protein
MSRLGMVIIGTFLFTGDKVIGMEEKPAIVIPLDGSRISALAIGAARALCEIMGGELHIVHVTDLALSDEQLLGHLKVPEYFEHIPHRLHGEIVDSILEFTLGIDAKLIVTSSHGETYNSRDIIGSKTRGLAQNSTIPIMIVRPDLKTLPDAGWKPRKMLVPLDGSPLPSAVVNQLFYLAERINLDIDVLHIAVRGKKRPPEAGSYAGPRYIDHPHYDWPAWADEFTKRISARRPPAIKLRLSYERGDPVDVTLEYASRNETDIIALSWHGRVEKKHATTVKGILRRSELPVLLIKLLD